MNRGPAQSLRSSAARAVEWSSVTIIDEDVDALREGTHIPFARGYSVGT